jgi:adenylate cyclase
VTPRRTRDESRHDPVTTSITTDATGELLMPLLATDTGPALAWAEAAEVDRLAPPAELEEGDTHLTLTRTFCFADLSGFTAFTRDNGAHAAVHVLDEFRRVTRNIATKRGVRVAKWLGDGCMVVAVEQKAGIEFVTDLANRAASVCAPLTLRAGLASGYALLFEGDDYIGSSVNRASRLCDHARQVDVLMPTMQLERLPEGVTAEHVGELDLRGFPGRIDVVRLVGAPAVVIHNDAGEIWTRSAFI